MLISDDLQAHRQDGAGSAYVTDDDGEGPSSPSHGTDSAKRNDEIDDNLSGSDRSEELGHVQERSIEPWQSHEEYLQQKAAKEERHRRIQKRKWERRGIF